MTATEITFEQAARNRVSLCIETSDGREVIDINNDQASQLANGLNEMLSPKTPAHWDIENLSSIIWSF